MFRLVPTGQWPKKELEMPDKEEKTEKPDDQIIIPNHGEDSDPDNDQTTGGNTPPDNS